MTTVAQSAWRIGQTQAPYPLMVPGLPLLGNALSMRRDPLAYFVNLYHKHGPIFRLRILNRTITALAGLESNRLLNGDGDAILSSKELFESFGHEFGTNTFLVALDGDEHLHMRKMMRNGYARSAMTSHLERLFQIVDEFTNTLNVGDTFSVLPTLQYLVTQQLGVIIADQTPDDYFVDLQRFLGYMLNVKVLKVLPSAALYLPAYRRSKARVAELARLVLEKHRQKALQDGERTNLIDDMLRGRDPAGNPYSEDTLIAATVGPYLAGIDTVASSLTFFVYAVLKHAEVMAAATDEARTLFAKGLPQIHDFKSLEMLHGAAIETLRMYPVAPFTPRHALKPFEFQGKRIDAGSEVFFAQTVTHYLPELYPEPHIFDPMRFAKGQGKGVPGAFAPYTLGQHL